MKPIKNCLVFTILLLSFCALSVRGQISSTQDGPWITDNRWDSGMAPSSSNCVTPINILHTIRIAAGTDVDLTSCGVLHIVINGGVFQLGHNSTEGSLLELASGSTIQITNGAIVRYQGMQDGTQAIINIGGNEVWSGDDGNITGEGFLDESSVNGSLPVDLISFTGESDGGNYILKWSTASEVDNEGFVIEYSTDKEDFTKIGWVDGHGTINTTMNYRFSYELGHGQYYFRLKQVDFDGEYEYSPTISVSSDWDGKIYSYPNPTSGEIYLNGPEAQVYKVSFSDMSGNEIIPSASMSIEEIETNINSVIDQLPSGVYFLTLIDAKQKVVERILVN
ncbi:T9SS type A sorting domain-containing protein [Reichenbachiella versicolor]|uniref:T9SS type A sorting domain-containing protein n=1 Tax=Reichenbachiella versicolor TaxID=1821036 RepID=UPI000D6EAFE7|nr:T9SS type A sorting domain-containing protein [Reichenbachiella versicolor]